MWNQKTKTKTSRYDSYVLPQNNTTKKKNKRKPGCHEKGSGPGVWIWGYAYKSRTKTNGPIYHKHVWYIIAL